MTPETMLILLKALDFYTKVMRLMGMQLTQQTFDDLQEAVRWLDAQNTYPRGKDSSND